MKKIALLLLTLMTFSCTEGEIVFTNPEIIEDPIEDPELKLLEKMVVWPSNDAKNVSKDGDGITYFYEENQLVKSEEELYGMNSTTTYEYEDDKIVGTKTSVNGDLNSDKMYSYDAEGRLISIEHKYFQSDEHFIGSYTYETDGLVRYEVTEVISGAPGMDYSIYAEVYTVDLEMNILEIERSEGVTEFLSDDKRSPYADIPGYLDAFRFEKRKSKNNATHRTWTETATGASQSWNITNTYDDDDYLFSDIHEGSATGNFYFYLE